jgi:glucokinase-like ROK family protein
VVQYLKKATHQQTRIYNSQLVLKTIYDQGPISRASVARLTKLNRATVSELVAELIERGLVAEIGRGRSTGGTLPILLSVVDDALHLISLDLSGEMFTGAVVNLRGEIRHRLVASQPARDGAQAEAMVYELVDALQAATQHPLLGIGIGAPGLIDSEKGTILEAVNLGWRNLPLGQLLRERYFLPVHIANDSQVAALAEQIFGECASQSSLIVIKINRGVGSGIVVDGRLYQGEGFAAGEIGHVRVVENGQPCRCGNTGCLETVASCSAVLRQAVELAAQTSDSVFFTRNGQSGSITLEELTRALQAGDPLACQVVQKAGYYLGIAIAYMVSTLNIQRVLLTGDITIFGQPWLETIRATVRQRILPKLASKVQIDINCLGTDVVILGASALLLTSELGLSLAHYAVPSQIVKEVQLMEMGGGQ